MKYQINDHVCVLKNNAPKIIDEIEIIEGQVIYYMKDKTSYHEDQIKFSDYNYELFENNLINNKFYCQKRYKSIENSLEILIKHVENEQRKEKLKEKRRKSKSFFYRTLTKFGLQHLL